MPDDIVVGELVPFRQRLPAVAPIEELMGQPELQAPDGSADR